MRQTTHINRDITTLDVDAIVNPTNTTLLGGDGLDGQIHDKAGPELLAECRRLNGCEHGEAKITRGYNLPAKYVIHTVGPIYGNHDGKEAGLLHGCYYNALKLADEHQLTSIAFPAISTGFYSYPALEAYRVAKKALDQYFKDRYDSSVVNIYLVSFPNATIFERWKTQPKLTLPEQEVI